MDPVTFGMVAIGVAGSSLCTVSILAHYGVKINEDAIKIALEVTKYGGMLVHLYHK